MSAQSDVQDEVQTKADLENIKNWLIKQPHLNVRQDGQWLLTFLRGCKYSIERTKQKLDLYYTMRTLLPEFFENRDTFLPELQEALKSGVCVPLPKSPNPNEPRVLLFRNDCNASEKITVINMIKITLMTMDILLNEDECFSGIGHYVLQNFRGITFNHLVQMTPSVSKKIIKCFQDAYPMRPKGFHYINTPSFFETLFSLIKPLLTEKLKNRVVVYSENNIQKLQDVISSAVLPTEYGGEGGDLNKIIDDWKEKVESYKDWFSTDAEYCSNEKLRPGEPTSSADIFGVEGSFRSLQVD